MQPNHDEQVRCARLCKAVWHVYGLTLEQFADVFGKSIATTQRLLQCLDHALWDSGMIDRAAAFVAGILTIPVADVAAFIRNQPTPYAELFRELAAAQLLLPNPSLTRIVGQKLERYNDVAGELYSHQFIFPASHLTESIHDSYVVDGTAQIGKIGRRFAGNMRKFFKVREKLTATGTVFPRLREYLFVPMSALDDMKLRRGPFRSISDEEYSDFYESLIGTSVLTRETRIGVYDDRILPDDLRRFLSAYDGLMTVAGKFSMSVHRRRFTRALCERTIVESPCNKHIDRVTAVLSGLKKYVAFDMEQASAIVKAKIVESLKPFAL